ncbi:MAG: hypothetical protein JW893_04940 [Candidatus Omnitrophica bacterium]|nr:hypothetical protein [Candidatus Omnitrophota bacterium]
MKTHAHKTISIVISFVFSIAQMVLSPGVLNAADTSPVQTIAGTYQAVTQYYPTSASQIYASPSSSPLPSTSVGFLSSSQPLSSPSPYASPVPQASPSAVSSPSPQPNPVASPSPNVPPRPAVLSYATHLRDVETEEGVKEIFYYNQSGNDLVLIYSRDDHNFAGYHVQGFTGFEDQIMAVNGQYVILRDGTNRVYIVPLVSGAGELETILLPQSENATEVQGAESVEFLDESRILITRVDGAVFIANISNQPPTLTAAEFQISPDGTKKVVFDGTSLLVWENGIYAGSVRVASTSVSLQSYNVTKGGIYYHLLARNNPVLHFVAFDNLGTRIPIKFDQGYTSVRFVEGEALAYILFNDQVERLMDLETLEVVPQIPEGWTVAASNSNFAFHIASEHVGQYWQYTLQLMNLVTGELQDLKTTMTPVYGALSDVFDVSPDGSTVIYGYKKGPMTDLSQRYKVVVQRIADPGESFEVYGDLESITFGYDTIALELTLRKEEPEQEVTFHRLVNPENLEIEAAPVSWKSLPSNPEYYYIAQDDQTAIVNTNTYDFMTFPVSAYIQGVEGTIAKFKAVESEEVIWVDLLKLEVVPQIPEGWTVAASNPDYAFHVKYDGGGHYTQYTLQLMNLITGEIQDLTTTMLPYSSLSEVRDVSPDGTTVIYGSWVTPSGDLPGVARIVARRIDAPEDEVVRTITLPVGITNWRIRSIRYLGDKACVTSEITLSTGQVTSQDHLVDLTNLTIVPSSGFRPYVYTPVRLPRPTQYVARSPVTQPGVRQPKYLT